MRPVRGCQPCPALRPRGPAPSLTQRRGRSWEQQQLEKRQMPQDSEQAGAPAQVEGRASCVPGDGAARQVALVQGSTQGPPHPASPTLPLGSAYKGPESPGDVEGIPGGIANPADTWGRNRRSQPLGFYSGGKGSPEKRTWASSPRASFIGSLSFPLASCSRLFPASAAGCSIQLPRTHTATFLV